MGGKTKQAQRTKNNSRPSSSGRAAELLGAQIPAFVGFTSVENYGGFMPVVPGFVTAESINDEDSTLDENYQLILKKMTKKDPTTKVKALQEFVELVAQADTTVFKALLPFWPRLYSNLATDVDHRVREASQKAHASVVTKAGKAIAPFLRLLGPAWISSQYDTYAPAASAATQSFQKAFPASKLKDVFMYCENEILEYFVRNLTQHTAQTLCNPKTHTPEECEAKYERVLISSLHGYALYLEKLPKDLLESVSEKNIALIENPKFWNLHKHKVPAIRAGWFKVISAILEFATVFVGASKPEQQKHFVTHIFQYLDETDPTVTPHIWACVILIQQNIVDWHQHLNMDKAVMPKLWKVLKSGGSGMATIIFPNLLPLISKFDKNILGEKLLKFQLLFFENMNLGLREVQASRAEITAIATAYYECLQYVVIKVQNADEEELASEEKMKISCKLLDDHLIAVIYWCMNAETTSGKYIFGPLTNLLNFWSFNSTTSPLYDALSKRFWVELYRCIESSLEMDKNVDKVTQAHVELIQNLKQSAHHRNRQAKVKFSGTSVDEVDAPKPADTVSSFEAQLTNLMHQVCKLYMEKASESKIFAYVQQLEYLMRDKEIHSLALFRHLAGGSENIAALYDEFSGWLYDSSLRSESVVEIILVLYKYLSVNEKVELLDKWIKIPIKTVQSWIILRSFSHPLCNEPNITKLLSQPEVTEHLLDSASQVTKGVFKENLNLLHKCFFQQENGDILIDKETCEKIVDIMCLPLTNPKMLNAMDTCGSFLSQIMPVVCSDVGKKELQVKMFVNLFEFSVNNIASEDLTEDTLYEISTCWQDALSSNDIHLTDDLLEICADTLNQKLATPIDAQTPIENVEALADLTAKLILCSTESATNDAEKLKSIDKIIDLVLNQRAKVYKEQAKQLTNLASYIEVLNGSLAAITLDDDSNVSKETLDATLEEYFSLSLFKLSVIFKLSCNIKKREKRQKVSINSEDDENDEIGRQGAAAVQEMEEDEDEYTEDFCNMDENLLKVWSDEIYDQLLECFYATALSDTVLYNTSQLNENFESLFLNLQEKLTLLCKNIAESLFAPLKLKLFVCANKTGLIWSKSLIYLLNLDQYSNTETGAVLLYEDSSTSYMDEGNMIGYINILETLSKKVKPNSLPILPNLFENYFDLMVKLAATRSLIWNHFTSNFNEIQDRKIIGNALIIINEIMMRQKEKAFLLYNSDISAEDTSAILLVAEIANFLADVIKCFPTELDLNRWDFIRIALSSWSLSVSKSWQKFPSGKVSIFIAAIYRLFAALTQFIGVEKTKSSTENLTKMITEWDNVFAKDVNLVLLKTYINMVSTSEASSINICYFYDAISPQIGTIDCNYILKANKIDAKTSLNDLILWCLRHLSNDQHSVRIACGSVLKKLTNGLIAKDMEILLRKNEQNYTNKEDDTSWHVFNQFEPTIVEHNAKVSPFIDTFTFKPSQEMNGVDKSDLLSYLLLWDSILEICGNSPPELRSTYAYWITDHQYEQIFLPTLFKLMPVEILKNPEIGFQRQTMFSKMDDKQILNHNIPLDRYACHLYCQTLRYLPALVRKWWHGSSPRQAGVVDKITTNFVSNQLCQEELASLIERKDKQDNMHITVFTPARQVSATYSMDEAKMELVITLPVNHPLGAVKVESGKQIGGRMQSRQVVMQLSIFLTHQNGSIWDGLSLWKRNLDRKFEGVEECYVCYSVIHQDTCQLPRLSCRTCKKKFHAPCLYRWFSTSNKSTCPICRNIF